MSKLFKKLKASLEKVIAYQQGQLHLRSKTIELPKPSANYKRKKIKKHTIYEVFH